MLIAIAGKKFSGKSTLADILVRDYGFKRISFAAPIKQVLMSLGLTHDQVYGGIKEVPTPVLRGQTPRIAMQTLGDWGRNLYEDFWVDRLTADPKELSVIDDLRYPNELRRVRELGGMLWTIERPSSAKWGDVHSSESHEFEGDVHFVNDGSMQDLAERVRTECSRLFPL